MGKANANGGVEIDTEGFKLKGVNADGSCRMLTGPVSG